MQEHQNHEIEESVQQALESPEEVHHEEQEPTERPVAQADGHEEPRRKESAKENNFRELRNKALALQRERDEALARLREFEAAQKTQITSQSTQEDDEEISLAPDELAEGKHLSKVGRKIKRLEQQLQSYQKAASEAAIETKIKIQYPDFDSVVTKENIEALRLLEPEFSETLNSSSNLYSKAIAAYKMIKKSGIILDEEDIQDKQAAVKNTAKPRSSTSVSPQQGASPLQRANAFANGLTEELKKQLIQEMISARKNF